MNTLAMQQSSRTASRTLNGVEKVAVLLLAMEAPLASGILKQFDPDELRQITRSAADIGTVPITSLEDLIEEFAGSFSSGPNLIGSASEAESLLSSALPPEQVSDIMADVMGNSNLSVWERLSAVSEQSLHQHLSGEHPQTAAFVLTKLTTQSAAKVIALMTPELRNAMTRRMLSLAAVSEASLKLVETALQEDLLNAPKAMSSTPHARMAEIVNRLDREQIDALLESLSVERPETAEILKSMLFNFEDIAKLSVKARLVLFEKVPAESVILALKGAEKQLTDLILSALSARAKKMVEQELASGETSNQRDVTKARRAIADMVLDLAERGLLDLNPSA